MQATLSSKAMVWIKESKGYKSDCKAASGLSCLVQRDGDRVSRHRSECLPRGQACFVLTALTRTLTKFGRRKFCVAKIMSE